MADVAELTKPSSASTREQTFEVRLRALIWEAPGVLSLELAAPDGSALPPFAPGAHIDLKLPDGTLRQYSLCGDPNDTSHYRLGIRAVAGGLSSSFIHRHLRPGELLTVSAPRNNFPLVDAARYIFVAGGIGITPLIPMMRARQLLTSTLYMQFAMAASSTSMPNTFLTGSRRSTTYSDGVG